MNENDPNSLYHYGKKGMKWGVTKKTPKDPRYSSQDRSADAHKYGKGFTKKVDKRLVKGQSYSEARRNTKRAHYIKNGIGVAATLAAVAFISSPAGEAAFGRIADHMSSSAARKAGEAAANAMADSRGLTSYQTVAMAFDAASGAFKVK